MTVAIGSFDPTLSRFRHPDENEDLSSAATIIVRLVCRIDTPVTAAISDAASPLELGS